MNYVEFKMSLLKALWIPNSQMFIERDIDNPDHIISHRHRLFVDDESGLNCGTFFVDKHWNLSWDEMERLVDDGKWQNYPDEENEGATIMDVDGERYRIWLYMPTSLDSLL